MDVSSNHFTFPLLAGNGEYAGASRAVRPAQSATPPRERPLPESVFTTIEAHVSRVHATEDAAELTPVIIESRPPAKIQRYLQVAYGANSTASFIDTYA